MANRHKRMCKKGGGGINKAAVSFGNMDVIREAKQKKAGGKVVGRSAGGRLDRKSGGKVGKAAMSSAGGGSADKSPFFK